MFIEQAYKGKNDWWRVAITTAVSTGIFILNFIVFLIMPAEQLEETYESMKEMPNSLGLIVNLAPFAFLIGALFLLVFLLHERSILSLTTSRTKIDFKRIGFSLLLVTIVTVVGFAISYFNDASNIVWNFKPVPFAIMVFISLLLFPCQIGFEEYLFRGFLMQQIGIVVRNRWFPLVVTSVVFGMFHSANPEVAEMGYGAMGFYIGTGLLLGIMTLMDEGMELALGFHLGNNLLAAWLVTADYSALQTDAMFRYSGQENAADTLSEMLLGIAITYPVILLILAKKYRWTGWREKLTGKISKPITPPDATFSPDL
ncbi:CAAX amino terminal protease family protein [Flavobacterium longum]|uniref:CPBP family intramembrane glutamic endopeptidase n=1 Tax=Flavobacterium longum TaxID=1299340 RepID=UPI0039E94D0B